jgi:hypothetical protein
MNNCEGKWVAVKYQGWTVKRTDNNEGEAEASEQQLGFCVDNSNVFFPAGEEHCRNMRGARRRACQYAKELNQEPQNDCEP